MFRVSALFLLAFTLAVAGCQDNSDDPRPIGRGYQNAPVAMTEPGLLLASWAGPDLMAKMPDASRQNNQTAEKRVFTAPIGQMVTWQNPANSDSGTVVALRDAYAKDGAYCRDFQQTLTLGGAQQTGQARACQQADGSWKVLD